LIFDPEVRLPFLFALSLRRTRAGVDIPSGLWYQPPLGTEGNFRASISVRRAMQEVRGGDQRRA
jgi:hypothetical protein